jgi:hypothetical protein
MKRNSEPNNSFIRIVCMQSCSGINLSSIFKLSMFDRKLFFHSFFSLFSLINSFINFLKRDFYHKLSQKLLLNWISLNSKLQILMMNSFFVFCEPNWTERWTHKSIQMTCFYWNSQFIIRTNFIHKKISVSVTRIDFIHPFRPKCYLFID